MLKNVRVCKKIIKKNQKGESEKALNNAVNTHKFSTTTLLKNKNFFSCGWETFRCKTEKSWGKGWMKTLIFYALQPQIRNHRRTMCDCIVRFVGKSLTHTHTRKRDEINSTLGNLHQLVNNDSRIYPNPKYKFNTEKKRNE